jgi:methylmalonyl-CoA/ethylmalonyl-CoA epimerase
MSTETNNPTLNPGQKAATPSLPVTGIAQIALVVKNLEQTVRNWVDVLGVGPWHFYTYGKPLVKRMTRHGQPAEYRMRVALANVGPMRIELIEHMEGDTVYQEFVDQHGYGVHHLGVLVEDMALALEQAKTAGFEMTQDGAGFGPDDDGHYAYISTEKALGTTFEFIQRPKRRNPPEKTYPA